MALLHRIVPFFPSDRLFAVAMVIVVLSLTAIGPTRLFGRVAPEQMG